jgi:hypothetical protein
MRGRVTAKFKKNAVALVESTKEIKEAARAAIFEANQQTYEAPRLQIALDQQGIRCGKQRIARLQRRFELHLVQER